MNLARHALIAQDEQIHAGSWPGLSTLVAAHRAAEDKGHVLTVRGARGMCLRVLRISGLHRVLVLDPPVD